ncbi:hypothetical protein Srot_1812 [Segniliparus rotundus DSM 44985]|uniref:Uncharacterized protein n=1 Tax=Segniliparus rotundus (strain ATCC BAA-972 / CDC 1076 / CIP 108378 / DSM 44985 / JCM 13578) TaxID=640132 RepID=D6Z8J2_SEGRD|nr:hypothetical protein Srot_1812 [Segniliparus rotundus DSM 44985]
MTEIASKPHEHGSQGFPAGESGGFAKPCGGSNLSGVLA